MTHDDHIHHKNHEFIGVEGPALASTFSHGLDLRFGDLDPTVYGGHTFSTAFSDSISEFTYIGGQYPLSSLDVAKSST